MPLGQVHNLPIDHIRNCIVSVKAKIATDFGGGGAHPLARISRENHDRIMIRPSNFLFVSTAV
jgi:hypothetical protein